MSKAITDADFEKDVLQSATPVVVDFWAPWCGPCKAMLPIVEQLEGEMKDKVTFVKMNVDENTDVPGKFNVMSIPTFIIFKGGEAVKSFVGTKSKEEFRKEIEAAIAA
jgi:thioredoxin 1